MRVPIPIALFFVNIRVPAPLFANGTLWLLGGFLLMNLLVLLEVADRLSLKRDLEVAREIQNAMLPEGTWSGPGVEAFGLTKPANTVGGDFYDILPQPDGTVLVALGDVAGKASPAALLMALLLAILRTLVDEGLPLTALVQRLNLQVSRHAPASRFITLFLASFTPVDRPSRVRQRRPDTAAAAPAKWIDRTADERRHRARHVRRQHVSSRRAAACIPGDALLMYSDGLTEAESPDGQPFDEAGLERTLALFAGAYQKTAAAELGKAVFDAVERHRRDQRLQDDLTVLVLSRLAYGEQPVSGVYRPESNRAGVSAIRRGGRLDLADLITCIAMLVTTASSVWRSSRPCSRGKHSVAPARRRRSLDPGISAGRRNRDLDDGSRAVDSNCCRRPPTRSGARVLRGDGPPGHHARRRQGARSIGAAGHAAGRRLPARRRSLHGDRPARPHRDVASRHPPSARRRTRPPAVAHPRRGSPRVDRRAASPRAASGETVRGEEPGAEGDRFRAAAAVRRCLRRGNAGRRDRDRAARRRHDGLPAGAEGRERAAEAVRRRRGARDAVHLGVRPPQPV